MTQREQLKAALQDTDNLREILSEIFTAPDGTVSQEMFAVARDIYLGYVRFARLVK